MKRPPHHTITFITVCFAFAVWIGAPSASASPYPSDPSSDFDSQEKERRDSGATSNLSASNPHSIVNSTFNQFFDRLLMAFSVNRGFGLSRPTAGATLLDSETAPEVILKDDSWFSNPAVFADYTYRTANDNRPFGLDSDQHDVNIGLDFETVYGFIAGMMITYSNMQGEANDAPGFPIDTENETVQLSWFLSKPLNDWLVAGASVGYALSDLNQRTGGGVAPADFDIDTVSLSTYLGAVYAWDQFGVASTVSYVYSDATWDPVNQPGATNDFNQSAGSLLWKTSGTWFATDWLDFTLAYKMTQILHENFNTVAPTGTRSDDNHFGDVSLRATVLPAANWSVFTGVEYTVFNANYEESVSVQTGATYSF